jgi:hypothetical protein
MSIDDKAENPAEFVRKQFVRASLKGLEAVFLVKEKNVADLRKYEGKITDVKPGEFINYTDKNGEEAHLPFCGLHSGLFLVTDKSKRMLFQNANVLFAYVDRLRDSYRIKTDEGRLELSKEGVFYPHVPHFPKEIHF